MPTIVTCLVRSCRHVWSAAADWHQGFISDYSLACENVEDNWNYSSRPFTNESVTLEWDFVISQSEIELDARLLKYVQIQQQALFQGNTSISIFALILVPIENNQENVPRRWPLFLFTLTLSRVTIIFRAKANTPRESSMTRPGYHPA